MHLISEHEGVLQRAKDQKELKELRITYKTISISLLFICILISASSLPFYKRSSALEKENLGLKVHLDSLEEEGIKPLEGFWNISVFYEKYHGLPNYIADGFAIFLWQPDKIQPNYEVYVAVGVKDTYGGLQAPSIVTYSFKALLPTDNKGNPTKSKETEFIYLSRTTSDNEKFKFLGNNKSSVKNLKPKGKPIANTITADFVGLDSSTIARLTFTRP